MNTKYTICILNFKVLRSGMLKSDIPFDFKGRGIEIRLVVFLCSPREIVILTRIKYVSNNKQMFY